MNLKRRIVNLLTILVLLSTSAQAEVDKQNQEYQALRDSMTTAFNESDSARFFVAIAKLEDYLLKNDDLHGYYTQRCNEIVFHINQQNIFEAYKLSMKLSRELRERKLDSELYMAINMMGHIYNFCGNEAMARKCFKEVLERMEKEGYIEGMPPIYMNLVQVEMKSNPEEAMRLIDKAAQVADTTRRRVDIEAYRAIYAFKRGDMEVFRKGYEEYKKQKAKGWNSVHELTLETYYLLSKGDIAEAVEKSKENSAERYSMQTFIYEWAGDWENAYRSLQREMESNDSINTFILTNNMQGIQNELSLYEAEREANRQRFIALLAVAGSLLVVIVVMFVYTVVRRRYIARLKEARDQALESDRMKTAFIRNISHEIRTPLNIISGFTQVLSEPDVEMKLEERKSITDMMMHNTHLITALVDELIDLSITDASSILASNDVVACNDFCREVLESGKSDAKEGVELRLQSDVNDSYELKTNRGVLRKVLNALVDNALKNTERGHVDICVKPCPSTIFFAVEDTGCGIPEKDEERIFERFEKLDTFKTGLGLGLPLARLLTERLGGTLKLDTSYIGGARFVVELPLP